MKILVLVSGIGFGDATREHANIIAIKKKFPHARIMVAGYDNSYLYFKDKFHTLKIRGYKMPGKSMKVNPILFGLRNLLLPAFWAVETLKVRLQAFNFIPDLIITDFEPVGLSLSKMFKTKNIVVFGFDPDLYQEYKKHHKITYAEKVEATYFSQLYDQADIVVIPTFKKRKKKHLRYTYINPIVRVKPEDLPEDKKIMKELGLKKKPILIMLGGSDFGTKIAKTINKLAPKFKEHFIIFGGNLDINLENNVHYIQYTSDFFKYLKVSKGLITLAGHSTLSEALVYKKAILCFPIHNHIEQKLNAFTLKDTIQISNKHSPKIVKKELKQFIKDMPKIEKQVKKLNIKASGPQDLVKIIETIMK